MNTPGLLLKGKAGGSDFKVRPNLHSILDIETRYKRPPSQPKTWKEEMRDSIKIIPQKTKHFFWTHFPIASFVRNYKRPCLLHDIVAGLAVCGLHFPQGLAYGLLAGLTPSIGLISSFFPIILYVLFGTSPHCSLGTNAVVSIMIRDLFQTEAFRKSRDSLFPMATQNITNTTLADADNPMAEELMQYKIGLAAGVSLYCGLVFFLMHFVQLGFIVSYLSQSLVSGFTTAAGLHIFSSQINLILGVSIPPFRGEVGKLIHVYRYIFQNIQHMNPVTLVTGIVCVLVLLTVKVCINARFKAKLLFPIPIDLIVLILGTAVGYFLQMDEVYRVAIIGPVETGIPVPAVPILQPIDLLLLEATEIALITFFLNISTLKFLSRKNDYEVDEETEIYSYGIVNFISSFFHSMPASVAPPRSVLLSDMHGKTTLSGIYSAGIMVVFIYWIGTYLASCPMCVLAAMVMVGVKDLILQIMTLPYLWRHNKRDFLIWLTTFVFSVFLDLKYGLVCGVLVSFFSVINQSQKGKILTLGKMTDEEVYLDIDTHDYVHEIPGIKILRMESSLYFATAERFRQYVYACIMHPSDNDTDDDDFFALCLASIKSYGSREWRIRESESGPNLERLEEEPSETGSTALTTNNNEDQETLCIKEEKPRIRSLILDCSCVSYVDMNGLDLIRRVVTDLKEFGVSTLFARCTVTMLTLMEKSDIFETVLDKNDIFLDIPDAVRHVKKTRRKISAMARQYLQQKRNAIVPGSPDNPV